jgi:hypothetical protein
METPDTPEELIGQEPTLFDLINNYQDNKDDYEEIDGCVLRNYSITYNKDQKLPTYPFYLGGQMLLNAEVDRITKSLIDTTKEIVAKKYKEYGEPVNSYEQSAIQKSKTDFDNLQKIIQIYYLLKMHNLYRPADANFVNDKGGIEYQKLEKNSRVGKL